MMGLLSGMIRPKAMSPVQEELIRSIYGGHSTKSGVSVSSDTAMRLITVQNCVRMRASTLSRLPCHIMKQTGRTKSKATDFYLYEKLLHQPCSWLSAPEFWGMAEAYVSLRGNFIAYKAGLPGRPIRELIPIPSGMIHEIKQNEDYSLDYAIKSSKTGEIKHLNETQVLHLRGLTLNGYTGMNPIEYARESIGKGIASEQHLAEFFGRGMRPGVIFEHPQMLSAAAYSNRKETLKEKYAGLGAHWEMMLIDEGMKATFPEIKLVDAQYLEQMKLTEAQICGMFRVPLMLVCAGDKAATYASAEQFMLFYQVFSIDAPVYESAIRRDLFTPEERKIYYVKFNMDALLRGDFKSRMEGYQIGINCEMLNPNEAREKEDMDPYEGGDEYRTRTSTTKDTGKEAGNQGAQK